MKQIYNTTDNPLVQGIKTIGIGKHGSKPLPLPLLEEIITYLDSPDVVPVQKGAFYGALMAKGATEEEKALLKQPGTETPYTVEELYAHLCTDAPAEMRETGIKLLKKESLSLQEAKKLGDFLYSGLPGETFRGMAVSMMRIRYETEEEYQGLMEAAVNTFSPEFREETTAPALTIQLAEPFDGVEHSYMITPLIAMAMQQAGHPVVVSTGRSSGPKLGLNARDIYQALGGPFIQSKGQPEDNSPLFGRALDQKDLSPALDEWVDRRRLIFKRPFLATAEKVLNPCGAQILITSVFHLTYMEKMVRLAAMNGFSGVIVLKRGLEGTLAPSIAKASGILCAAKQADGSFITTTIEANNEAFTAYRAEADDNVEPLLPEDNLELIRRYAENGATGNNDFDKRTGLALALYREGLNWIKKNLTTG